MYDLKDIIIRERWGMYAKDFRSRSQDVNAT